VSKLSRIRKVQVPKFPFIGFEEKISNNPSFDTLKPKRSRTSRFATVTFSKNFAEEEVWLVYGENGNTKEKTLNEKGSRKEIRKKKGTAIIT
jgi:hypothetical protein